MRKDLEIKIDGHLFHSKKEIADYAGVSLSTIYSRIKKYGINSSKVITGTGRKYKHIYYVDGIKVVSLISLAKKLNTGFNVVYDFIVMQHHETTTMKQLKKFVRQNEQKYYKHPFRGKRIEIDGIPYASVNELGRTLNLSGSAIHSRWKKYQFGEITKKQLMAKKHD